MGVLFLDGKYIYGEIETLYNRDYINIAYDRKMSVAISREQFCKLIPIDYTNNIDMLATVMSYLFDVNIHSEEVQEINQESDGFYIYFDGETHEFRNGLKIGDKIEFAKDDLCKVKNNIDGSKTVTVIKRLYITTV